MNNTKKLITFILVFFVSIVSIFTIRSVSSISAKSLSSQMSGLKGYIITLKETCPDSEASSIKSKISEAGGKITNEFTLIKAFSVELPEIHADALPKEFPGIATIEEDKEVNIQN
ncbi:PBI2 Protease B inhibitor 2 [Candida maltosa Xu316]